jgi:hypothetical protein
MIRYALRNALHYRAKYAAAFSLICAVSFILALSLFGLRGVQRESAKYARAFGDIEIYSSDGMGLRAAVAGYFAGGQAARIISLTMPPSGTLFNSNGQWSIDAFQLEEMRQLGRVELSEGAFPAEGETILPTSFKKKVTLGETLTYLYKTRDGILDSRKLRVSGFYVPLSLFRNYAMLVSPEQTRSMDPSRTEPNYFVVFLAGYGRSGAASIPEMREFDSIKAGLEAAFKPSGLKAQIYPSSWQRQSWSQRYIELFIMILVIFIGILLIVAAMTVVNVLFLALLDRVRIVATFMSFGMTRSRAVLMLACETLAFALAASFLGAALAWAVSPLLHLYRFDMDNWLIYMLLGDSKRITCIPNLADSLLTLGVGTALPFVTAIFAIRKLLSGELAQLLSFKK